MKFGEEYLPIECFYDKEPIIAIKLSKKAVLKDLN